MSENENVLTLKGLKILKDRAFNDPIKYGKIKEINLPDVESIGMRAFEGCWDLERVALGGQLKKLGVAAFDGCQRLKTIEIPEGVEEVPEAAFGLCSGLENILLPKTIKSIHRTAFATCNSLESIKIAPGNEHFKSEPGHLIDLKTGDIVARWVPSIDSNGVKTRRGRLIEMPKTGHVVLPEGVTDIPRSFGQHLKVESITFPATLKEIGASAFSGCENLSEVKFKSKVYLDICAFSYCANLKNVTGNFNASSGVFLKTPYQHKMLFFKKHWSAYRKWSLGWRVGGGWDGRETLKAAYEDAQKQKIKGVSWQALGYLMALNQSR